MERLLLLLSIIFIGCKSADLDLTYTSEDLKLIRLTQNSYVHVSNLQLSDGSRFACNGLVYVNDGEVAVFDSPSDPEIAKKLISWLQDSNKLTITAFVANHFHNDCIGGIEAFHEKDITSYGHIKTLAQIKDPNKFLKQTFQDTLLLNVGKEQIANRYFGEAHTIDNIISYIPGDRLLFGGCMVKSINASKGNLEDANVLAWPKTIEVIKNTYPDLKIIIPGHGKVGDATLLDYTIALFSAEP